MDAAVCGPADSTDGCTWPPEAKAGGSGPARLAGTTGLPMTGEVDDELPTVVAVVAVVVVVVVVAAPVPVPGIEVVMNLIIF